MWISYKTETMIKKCEDLRGSIHVTDLKPFKKI